MNNTLHDLEIEVLPFKIEVEASNKYSMVDSWTKSRPHLFSVVKNGTSSQLEETDLVVFSKGTESEESWLVNEYYDKLAEMDLALGYSQVCTFTIRSSTALREFFYQFDEKARWAQTSRQGIPNIRLASSELIDDINPKVLSDTYKRFIDNELLWKDGKLNYDKFRESMPLSFPVTYQLTTSVKQFVKYLSILYKYLRNKLPSMWEEIYQVCYNTDLLRPWLKNIYKYINCDESKLYYSTKDLSGDSEFLHCNRVYKPLGKIGKVLYSQLIRHEGIYTLGYINFLENLSKSTNPICGTTFEVAIHYSSDERFHEILKKRCRYFASNTTEDDPNSWLFITKRYVNYDKDGSVDLDKNKHLFEWFDEEGTFHPEILGKYDTDEDSKLRSGYNIYLPDAFSLQWRSVAVMRMKMEGESFLNKLFIQHFDKGYVSDNPNNPRRLLWMKLNPDRDFDILTR